ncbi:TetR/AcrR family transcriptional regulator [Dactylosporangium sp. CA-139114]|uniref:TetR/AcrR family transcriptional regulator n=1 Tax=Dactylosporangium sp. CA-139114 TaxID=3239931 RepID=UPI003D96A940
MTSTHTGTAPTPSTKKGRATRERIIAAAADLMYRHGVAGTSTPSVRDAAGVSSSQIYHYFGDKDDLTKAVIAYQTDLMLALHTQLLARVENLDALDEWRNFLVESTRQQSGMGGCPLGSLANELADDHPWARQALATSFDRWLTAIRTALATLVDNRTLHSDTDIDQLALALLAAIQGGLVLAQAHRNTTALEAGLDTALATVRSHATDTEAARPSTRQANSSLPRP